MATLDIQLLTHSSVLQLLGTTTGSQVLARRLYRTFAHEGSETVLSDDLRPAFDNDDEADAAFTMFDKDLNGDISMEELEAVCVEIGRERKAITASLKDLDSVVSKLDDILFFAVAVIILLVFVSLISTSASTAITSLGSTVLALSWLFSATAQEFLQSIIFVFVKHPFDVGDRVTIYGNTGSQMKGDDYFVKEISLLFTEFKKMEGHVVQAPNSYLNTLFILNQRRSGGLAEAVPVTVKFGTTLEQIETLRNRLLEFVAAENREYQKNILTELTTIYEAYSITLNVVFFYKSNWQNELLRLQRRNKFICAMMVTMQELGMEGPRMKLAGAAPEWPMYLNDAYPHQSSSDQPLPSGPGPRSGSLAHETSPNPNDTSTFQASQPIYPPTSPPIQPHSQPVHRHSSILRNRNGSSNSRYHGESISQMGKRVDFSLGMSSISSGADFGDVYEDRKPKLPPQFTVTCPSPDPGRASRDSGRQSHETESLARMNSRDSMGRVMSANSGRTHRNRFFPKGRSKLGSAEEGTNLDDLEAGTREFTVNDMPDIPEASRANFASWGEETEKRVLEKAEAEHAGMGRKRAGTASETTRRVDPRTGIVSPQAVAEDSALERGELPAAAPRRAVTDKVTRF